MGYYSSLEIEISRAVVDIKAALELQDQYRNGNAAEGFESVSFGIEAQTGKLLNISLDEYYGKFYGGGKFAEDLSRILKKGKIKLLFTGEDGERWGYLISPGEVEDIVFLELTWKEYTIIKEILEYMEKPGEKDPHHLQIRL